MRARGIPGRVEIEVVDDLAQWRTRRLGVVRHMPAFEPFDWNAILQTGAFKIQFSLESRSRDVFVPVQDHNLALWVCSQDCLKVCNTLRQIKICSITMKFPIWTEIRAI